MFAKSTPIIKDLNGKPEVSDFLSLTNVSKAFQEGSLQRVVLENASASFQKGEFVAILGKSGTGKSTLLNVISGIDDPDAGTICINGEDLTLYNENRRTLFRRRHIGFIFQFFNLIPTLTVWENIILPIELNGKLTKTEIARAESLLDSVELLDRRETYPDRLSGGEQQRVAIARALAHNPYLVLADEPTGNLDEETGKKILHLLDSLTRRAGKNLIMVTHSVEAAAYADRILYLKDHKFTSG